VGKIFGGVENITDITSLKKIKSEVAQLQSHLKKIYGFDRMVGKHPKMLTSMS